jgi:hypothetical protein
MANTSNLKDTVTTIAGIVATIGGSILASGVDLSTTVKSVLGIAVAVSLGLIGYFTGKPNGTAKTDN